MPGDFLGSAVLEDNCSSAANGVNRFAVAIFKNGGLGDLKNNNNARANLTILAVEVRGATPQPVTRVRVCGANWAAGPRARGGRWVRGLATGRG